MKYSTILFFTLMTCGASHLVAKADTHEHLQSALASCSIIDSESERLQCYDKIATSIQIQHNIDSTSNKIARINDNSANDLIKQGNTNATPKQITAKIDTNEQMSSKEKEFGKPKKVKPIQAIHSSILGKFKGWKKGTRLKLANGQIWKVVSSTRTYANLDSPKITISKAILGSFSAKIEGVTAIAKVKRVK